MFLYCFPSMQDFTYSREDSLMLSVFHAAHATFTGLFAVLHYLDRTAHKMLWVGIHWASKCSFVFLHEEICEFLIFNSIKKWSDKLLHGLRLSLLFIMDALFIVKWYPCVVKKLHVIQKKTVYGYFLSANQVSGHWHLD